MSRTNSMDRYDVQARYAPAILCSAPFILIGFYFLNSIDADFWNKLLALSFGGVTMSVALYFLFAYSCRAVGKMLEERMFNNGLDFPTTNFLLKKDPTFSEEQKTNIRAKIKSEFGIDLDDKVSDTCNNRRRINEAVCQIRRKHSSDNKILLQRNIYFGFAKNMAGGSIIAILASLVATGLSMLFSLGAVMGISVILLLTYLLTTCIFIVSMKFTSKHYALMLFDSFLGNHKL